jgi:hypothetical protein
MPAVARANYLPEIVALLGLGGVGGAGEVRGE